MSVGIVALLLGIGMVLALRAKITGLGVALGVIFGFVLGLTPLGGPVREALEALGNVISTLFTQ